MIKFAFNAQIHGFVVCCSISACLVANTAAAQTIEIKALPFGADAPLPFAKPVSGKTDAGQQVEAATAKWEVATRDITMANTLQRWAKSAGWQVRWDAKKHVLVEAPDTITGSFEEAVASVLDAPGIAKSAYPLEVCFYPNQPPLARITRKGDQDQECK